MRTIGRGVIVNIKNYWSSYFDPVDHNESKRAIEDIGLLCKYISEQDQEIRDLRTENNNLKTSH